MKLEGKNFLIVFIVLILGLSIISASSAYSGTGFIHDIPFSKYSGQSNDDILNKYYDTDCQAEFTGKCTYVTDGDTIEVDGLGKIRLVGVNTPERGQTGYICSKRFVQKLCLDKKVSLDIDDSKHTDKYGRYLAVVIVDGKSLNEMLLKEGLAEVMYIPPSEFYPYDWAPDTNGYSKYLSSYSSSNSGSSSSSSFTTGSTSSIESAILNVFISISSFINPSSIILFLLFPLLIYMIRQNILILFDCFQHHKGKFSYFFLLIIVMFIFLIMF